jgi:hypothetical protein
MLEAELKPAVTLHGIIRSPFEPVVDGPNEYFRGQVSRLIHELS